MDGQPRVEELINKIIFLRKALEFYADKKSFATHQGGPSAIDQDRGHQARFALQQSEDIEKYNQELIDEYFKNIETVKNQMDDPEITPEMLTKLEKIDILKKKYGKF